MSQEKKEKTAGDSQSEDGRTQHLTPASKTSSDGNKVPVLVVIKGKRLGEEFLLKKGDYILGRVPECELFISDPKISRNHARIEVRENEGEGAMPEVTIVDLNSTNGVLVNDVQISQAILSEGDKILVGDTVFKFNHHDFMDLRYQSQIKNLINIDNLTGLFTKRTFDEKFEQALTIAKVKEGEISVLMMDLDHFKSVNDNHNHLIGSYVLHIIGGMIKSCLDRFGISGRYGGEEFITFLPGTSKQKAWKLANELRMAIENAEMEKDDVTVKITISIGVSTYPEDGSEPETLVLKADTALYKCKETGRNKVLVFEG